jgi:hypothetical protein
MKIDLLFVTEQDMPYFENMAYHGFKIAKPQPPKTAQPPSPLISLFPQV